MLALPPLSLYIHIPWCEKKCPYCDFNSHTTAVIPEEDYLDSLTNNLNEQLHWVQGRAIKSIFIGGGTPSLMSSLFYEKLFNHIDKTLCLDNATEITMEANPGSAEQKKFAQLQQLGINRLSLGIQSFNNKHLQKLGRIHDEAQALSAIEAAHQAGFHHINLDLMHGLPEQTSLEALQDLEKAIRHGITHISWYQLTIEKNTEFYKSQPILPVEDTLGDIQEKGHSLLTQSGFDQYEVSAYCKDKEMATHNLNYWTFGDYLAIGAGAHGKITLPADAKIIRFNNTRLPKHYLNKQQSPISNITAIDQDDRLFEALMNGLRLKEGVNKSNLLKFTGVSHEALDNKLAPFINQGLIIAEENIKATELGFLHLNIILEGLLDN